MDADARSRLAYLAQARAVLWPEGQPTEPLEDPVTATVLPSASRPRVYAPDLPRRAGASAVLRYTAQQGWRLRAMGAGLAGVIRLGLHERMATTERIVHRPGPDSIDAHLASVLGQPVETSLALTPDRANRKPVLEVFDRAGRSIAFAKLGTNDLTERLVRAEAAALTTLARHDLPHLLVPRLLDCDRWHDMTVLVMSSLPMPGFARLKPQLLLEAMLEVSRIADEPRIGAESYVHGLRARARAATPIAGEDFIAHWSELLDGVVAIAQVEDIVLGSWHGDWTSWNCGPSGERVSVWDWERFAQPVPVGYDRLHHSLNREVGRDRRNGFPRAAPVMVQRAPDLLEPWQLSTSVARTTALLYVLDVSLRYMADDQRATGGGGTVERWAFPTVSAALANHPRLEVS